MLLSSDELTPALCSERTGFELWHRNYRSKLWFFSSLLCHLSSNLGAAR